MTSFMRYQGMDYRFRSLVGSGAEYAIENIILAILINMLIGFVVLRNLSIVEKILGKGGVYILRKFFGIILLAIAVKLFTANITSLF